MKINADITTQPNDLGFTSLKTAKGYNLTTFGLSLTQRNKLMKFIRKDILQYKSLAA